MMDKPLDILLAVHFCSADGMIHVYEYESGRRIYSEPNVRGLTEGSPEALTLAEALAAKVIERVGGEVTEMQEVER